MFYWLSFVFSIFLPIYVIADEVSIENYTSQLDSAPNHEAFRKLGSTQATTEFLKAKLREAGAQSLCADLETLAHEDLSYFANALLVDPELKDTSCLRRISARFEVSLKWRQHQLLLASQNSLVAVPDQSQTLSKRDKLGPSEARYLPANSSYNLPWDDPLPKGTFALTFDDGPHPSRTEQVLDILDAEDVHATFFVLGQAIDRNPQIVREISRRGHTLGGHTYTHPDLARRSYPSAVREIERGFESITAANGGVDPFFRFPYGSKTNSLMNYLRSENLHHFFWRIDTLDWKKKNPTTLLNYAVNQTVKAGKGIILFHDIHPQTVAMLPAFLRELKKRDYKVVVYKSR